MLVINNLKFVLIKECPQILDPNALRNICDAYERWISANEKAQAYILASDACHEMNVLGFYLYTFALKIEVLLNPIN